MTQEQTQETKSLTGLNLYERLRLVVNAVGWVEKSAENTFSRYNYAPIEAVTAKVREALSEAGLYVSFTVADTQLEQVETSKGTPATHALVQVDYTVHNVDDPTQLLCMRCPGEALDTSDKAINKALTASRKYFYFQAFHIPTGDDPDAQTNERSNQQTKTSQGTYASRSSQAASSHSARTASGPRAASDHTTTKASSTRAAAKQDGGSTPDSSSRAPASAANVPPSNRASASEGGNGLAEDESITALNEVFPGAEVESTTQLGKRLDELGATKLPKSANPTKNPWSEAELRQVDDATLNKLIAKFAKQFGKQRVTEMREFMALRREFEAAEKDNFEQDNIPY